LSFGIKKDNSLTCPPPSKKNLDCDLAAIRYNLIIVAGSGSIEGLAATLIKYLEKGSGSQTAASVQSGNNMKRM
jgi:hypothetical protein